jgi:hypothetical protein
MRQIDFAIVVAAPRLHVCVLLVLVCALLAHAQKASDEQFPKFEVFGAYSSIETNNHTFHFGPPNFNAKNTDFDEGGWGFEAGLTRNLNRYFGIMGDFSAHFSHDHGPTKFTIAPCAQPPCTVTQNAELNPRLFDFVAGPEFKWRNRTRLTPFAHALFGMAYTATTFKTASPALTLSLATMRIRGSRCPMAGGLRFAPSVG